MLRAANERGKSSKQRCPALRVFDMLKSHASLCPPEEYFAYRPTSAHGRILWVFKVFSEHPALAAKHRCNY